VSRRLARLSSRQPGRPRAHSCRLGAADPLARLRWQRRSQRQVVASDRAALRIHCAAPSLTLVGGCDHDKPSKRHDCAGNNQRKASLAKCSRHRDVRTVRRSGQSRDEFADTLSVLFNAAPTTPIATPEYSSQAGVWPVCRCRPRS